jgi:hypothetical protein
VHLSHAADLIIFPVAYRSPNGSAFFGFFVDLDESESFAHSYPLRIP